MREGVGGSGSPLLRLLPAPSPQSGGQGLKLDRRPRLTPLAATAVSGTGVKGVRLAYGLVMVSCKQRAKSAASWRTNQLSSRFKCFAWNSPMKDDAFWLGQSVALRLGLPHSHSHSLSLSHSWRGQTDETRFDTKRKDLQSAFSSPCVLLLFFHLPSTSRVNSFGEGSN